MSFFKDLESTLLTGPEDVDSPSGDTVDQAFDAMVEEEEQQAERSAVEYQALSEVERRLGKADMYRAVLNTPLFPGETSESALEVEQEYREFTLKRLNALVGIPDEASLASSLEPEEIKVLKIWALKLLNKPSVIAAAPAVTPEPRPAPVMAPVVVAPKPVTRVEVAKVTAPARTFTQPTRPASPQPVRTSRPANKPKEFEDENGFIHKGNKKFVRKSGRDALTGKSKEILVDVTETVKPVGQTPAPYPNQQAALMHEANVAAMFVPGNGSVLGQALQKVTTRTSSGE